MDFLELSKQRYSVRKFSDAPLDEGKLAKILEAGRLAPTAANSQSHRIFVLKSPEALAKVRALTPMTYGAPTVLMVCYDTTKSWNNRHRGEDYDGGEVDAAIVTTAMMMEATELGVGTLWARGFLPQPIAEAFKLPEQLRIVCLLALGTPAGDSAPAPRHTDRLPLSETVTVW